MQKGAHFFAKADVEFVLHFAPLGDHIGDLNPQLFHIAGVVFDVVGGGVGPVAREECFRAGVQGLGQGLVVDPDVFDEAMRPQLIEHFLRRLGGQAVDHDDAFFGDIDGHDDSLFKNLWGLSGAAPGASTPSGCSPGGAFVA